MKRLSIYLLLLLLSIQSLGAQNEPYTAEQLPYNINFSRPDSTIVNIEEFGKNLTVLFFWTSWNGESRKQLQYIYSLSRKMAFRPVSFVAVSLDVNRDIWLKYINKFGGDGLTQLYAGKDKEIIKQFNIVAVPSIAILNKNGYIYPADNSYNIHDKLEEALAGLLQDNLQDNADDKLPMTNY